MIINTRHLAHTKRVGKPAGIDLIDRSQARNLCGDDIVKHPETGRYVRVSDVLPGETHVGVIAVDIDTFERVTFAVKNRRQFNVYAD